MTISESVYVSASVALTTESELRCQVRSPEAVEFFWEQTANNFDIVFTPAALRELMRQAAAALDAVETITNMEDRDEEHGEFLITQGHSGRIGTLHELRQRLGLPADPSLTNA